MVDRGRGALRDGGAHAERVSAARVSAIALLAARALTPYATQAVRTTIAVTAVVVLAAVGIGRLAAARTDPLGEFVERIRDDVATTPALRASTGFPENDALVLRWRLDRSIGRGPLRCRSGELTLAPGGSLVRARTLGLEPIDVANTKDGVALLGCPQDRVVNR